MNCFLKRTTASAPLARCLLVAVLPLLANCGGGGGGEGSPPPTATPTTPTAPADPWAGTAYVKQERRSLFVGKTAGLARQSAMALFDLCNAYRKAYGLTENLPAESLLAGMDTQTIEKWYDSGKALTWSRGYTLTPTDFERWQAEVKASPGVTPAVAPDCSVSKRQDIETGELWVDGVHYDLRTDKKALGRHSAPSLKVAEMFTAAELAAMTDGKVLDQACKRSTTTTASGTATACFSTRFPLKSYLNWPWPLEGTSLSGTGESATQTELKLLEATVDKPSPAGTFKVPDGYTATVLD